MLDGAEIACPWCGEPLWIAIDPSAGSPQQFVSDCEICCRPITLVARIDRDGHASLEAAPE